MIYITKKEDCKEVKEFKYSPEEWYNLVKNYTDAKPFLMSLLPEDFRTHSRLRTCMHKKSCKLYKLSCVRNPSNHEVSWVWGFKENDEVPNFDVNFIYRNNTELWMTHIRKLCKDNEFTYNDLPKELQNRVIVSKASKKGYIILVKIIYNNEGFKRVWRVANEPETI